MGFAHDLPPKHPNPILSVHSWVEPTLQAARFLISIMNRHYRAGGDPLEILRNRYLKNSFQNSKVETFAKKPFPR
ncbi:hypothetical protein, partial [Neisseria sp. HMSC077D05]|uniref:hypothetical protein n=1 Tax=Neisseria sp. HMSC077D05 TaxID=1715079 RepID=UPI001AEFE9E0